jgi:hypothetical protein
MTANIPSALSLKFSIPRRSIRGYILSGALLVAGIAFGTAMMVSHVARQSGWEHSDNQDGHFGGRGGRMIVAARR